MPDDRRELIKAALGEAEANLAITNGTAVCAGGKMIAEIALPVGGIISTGPMEAIAAGFEHIQKAANGLGAKSSDIHLTMSVLPTPAIPFLRICESGLFNLRENSFVELIVD